MRRQAISQGGPQVLLKGEGVVQGKCGCHRKRERLVGEASFWGSGGHPSKSELQGQRIFGRGPGRRGFVDSVAV